AKVRTVCHSSQRVWIERQSPGRVAAVQVSIWLSIGTSTARVMTSAASMSTNPAASHQNAAVRSGHSRTRVTRALSRARGSRTAMGTPRFWIISWPTARKVSDDSWSIVRLSENQVPPEHAHHQREQDDGGGLSSDSDLHGSLLV